MGNDKQNCKLRVTCCALFITAGLIIQLLHQLVQPTCYWGTHKHSQKEQRCVTGGGFACMKRCLSSDAKV